jgi:hypothetical protein
VRKGTELCKGRDMIQAGPGARPWGPAPSALGWSTEAAIRVDSGPQRRRRNLRRRSWAPSAISDGAGRASNEGGRGCADEGMGGV